MQTLREALLNRPKQINVAGTLIGDIKTYIQTNYKIYSRGIATRIDETNIDKVCKFTLKNGTYFVDAKRGLLLDRNATSLTGGLPFVWRKCKNFSIIYNQNIITLEGGPEIIDGNLNIKACQNLQTLSFPAKIVKGDFEVSNCNSLISLDTQTDEVTETLDISACSNFKKLGVNISKINTFWISDCKTFNTLEGCPKTISLNFTVYSCPEIKTLEKGPENVSGKYCCRSTGIRNLKGAPEKIKGDFNCSKCLLLETLEGGPKYVSGNFDCHDCISLQSLEGSPEIVSGSFDCSKCPSLENLKGAPKEIGKDLNVSSCENLTSLECDTESVRVLYTSNCVKLYITNLENIPEIREGVYGYINGNYGHFTPKRLQELYGK